jgi:energy-coupling factor transporter ATP-binding protein EcfA2
MSLKALAEAALQQCAPRTLPAHSSVEVPAHSSPENETVRTLSDGEKSALAIAQIAIEQASLTDEQKASRLSDIEHAPSIAHFWAALHESDQKTLKEKKCNIEK